MENRALRISIVIAGIILTIVIVLIYLFSRNSGKNIKQTAISPTPISNSYQNNTPTTVKQSSKYYESDDFVVFYNSEANSYTINKKTSQAEEKITQWLAEHPELGQDVIISNETEFPTRLTSTEVNKKIAFGVNYAYNIINNLRNKITPTPISPSTATSINKNRLNFIYYPQCNGDYDNYPLPSGCTICKAGCGPTTVAMIVASYADSTVTPPRVVDQYQSKNQYLSCAGSGFSSAKMVLESYGLRTSDYLFSYGLYPIDEVASDFKNYINNGWTIFALANFRENGGGHYFWITDIDENNNVWAYDPFYGRFQAPPLNENSRYPFPKYKIAFAVKK